MGRPLPILPRDGSLNVIVGAPGTGKTRFAARISNFHALREHRRVVVLDPTGDVHKWLREEHKVPPEEIAVVGDYAAAVARINGGPGDFYYGKSIVCIQRKDRLDIDAMTNIWLSLANLRSGHGALFAGSRGFVFVADEAELAFPNHELNDDRKTAIKLARNCQQTTYLVSQYPQALSAFARSNATNVCVFKADSKLFVKSGCQPFGDVELYDAARDLKQFRYLWRPRYRDDYRAPLEEFHSVHDRIPFLERRDEERPWRA